MRRPSSAAARIGAASALFLAALSACQGGETQASLPPNTGRQLIVAVDLSGSQSDGRRAEAKRASGMIVDSMQYGDRLVLLRVNQRSALEDDAVRWDETFPAPRTEPPGSLDREGLDAARHAAHSVVDNVFSHELAGHLPTTDLIATLHAAGEYVRDANGRPTTIVLMSDMLQSAHGIEMSRVVPGGEWIEEQSRQGLLPELSGACVIVIGADDTNANGVAVRNFWEAYVTAAGGHLSSYRLFATDLSSLRCD
jgi:hypothetical protein